MKKLSLPILETLYKSIAWPWHYRKQLGLALLPMFLALVCLELVSLYISGMGEEKRSLLIALASIPFGILYVITVHRFLILGPEATPKFGMFEWRSREWNFLFYSLGLGILVAAIGLIFLLVSLVVVIFSGVPEIEQSASRQIAMVAVALPVLLVIARLSLLFPAIATDSGFSVQDVWEAGRGNTIRLVAVVFLVPAASTGLYYILPGSLHQNFGTSLTILWTVFSYALWAIEIACLSFAYKYLVAPTGAAD